MSCRDASADVTFKQEIHRDFMLRSDMPRPFDVP